MAELNKIITSDTSGHAGRKAQFETGIGPVTVHVLDYHPWEAPSVGVSTDEGSSVGLNITVERERDGWRISYSNFYYKGEPGARRLPAELKSELIQVAEKWADANGHLFLEHERKSFYQHFRGCARNCGYALGNLNEALDYLPDVAADDEACESALEETALLLSSRAAQLATPSALKAANEVYSAMSAFSGRVRQLIEEAQTALREFEDQCQGVADIGGEDTDDNSNEDWEEV